VDAETKQILGAAILGAGGNELILLDVMCEDASHGDPARYGYSFDSCGISPPPCPCIGVEERRWKKLSRA